MIGHKIEVVARMSDATSNQEGSAVAIVSSPPRSGRLRLVALVATATLIVGACGPGGQAVPSSASATTASAAAVTLPPSSSVASSPSVPAPPPTPAPLPTAVPLKVAVSIDLPYATGIAELDGAIWVTTATGVSRIDPATNKVTATIQLGKGAVGELAWLSGSKDGLWVSDYETSTVYRIDPSTRQILATIPVGLNPEGIVATPDGVWVANHHDGTVSRIDPTTNAVVATVHVTKDGNNGPQPIASGLGSIWVGSPNNTSVDRIDPATNQVQAKVYDPWPGEACGGFAIATGAVWSSSCMDSPTITRIDPTTNKVIAAISVGGDPGNGGMGDPVLVNGLPWAPVSNYIDRGSGGTRPGALVRIDPVANQVDRVLGIGDSIEPQGMIATSNSVWLIDTTTDGGRVLRVRLSALN